MRGESLHDGTLSLEQLAEMNDLIDVMDENEMRLNPPPRK